MFDSKKRSRTFDEGMVRESEGDRKKPRTLPFRTSPTDKHTLLFSQSPRSQPRPLLTPSITPVESSEDEDERPPEPCSTPLHDQSNCQLATNAYDVDSDMDMMDLQPPSSPPPWNDAMSTTMPTPPRPSSFDVSSKPLSRESQDGNNGGRIPTPRWGHFRPIDMSIDLDDSSGAASHAASHGPTGAPQLEVDHGLFLRRRRLPSPISEDENMISPLGMMEDTMERPDDMGTMPAHGIPSWEHFGRGKSDVMSSASPGPKAGRTMLSMGYRADCEKCRTRVPGHYNHVIQM